MGREPHTHGPHPAREEGAVEQLPRLEGPALGEELELALAELREDYRTCFVMYHQKELSYQEIGEVLDCPQGTIKTWLHRARAQLARRLQERGIVADPSTMETT